MKIKNKKIILITIMSSMGVGLLALSIGNINPQAKKQTNAEALNVYGANSKLSNDDAANIYMPDIENNNGTPTPTKAPLATPTLAPSQSPSLSPAPSPSPSPTSAPLKVYELEENKNTDIDKLFQSYYIAKYSRDIDKLKKLFSNPKDAPSKSDLKNDTQYIDDVRSIKCYTKNSYEKSTYIVYVSYEIKYINIKTTAPRLDRFYVITDKDGKLKIYSSEYSKELKEYLSARDKDADVQKVIKNTVDKLNKAKEKDKNLREYLKKLE